MRVLSTSRAVGHVPCAVHRLNSRAPAAGGAGARLAPTRRDPRRVDDLFPRRAAEADLPVARRAGDLPRVHPGALERRDVVLAVVEVPDARGRDGHALRALEQLDDFGHGVLLGAVAAPGHERRVDLDALATRPRFTILGGAAPRRGHENTGVAELRCQKIALRAVGAAGVARGDDAHVARAAKGFGVALSHRRQGQRPSPVSGILNVGFDLVGRALIAHHALLPRQGAVHVEGAKAILHVHRRRGLNREHRLARVLLAKLH
mmetsp:Transcript_61257/g.187015  ORF Transcript_61257/g.187015 Transcript_61257/m.187015 type:complete len:262 (-) Transcript_61257:288-1073(-)